MKPQTLRYAMKTLTTPFMMGAACALLALSGCGKEPTEPPPATAAPKVQPTVRPAAKAPPPVTAAEMAAWPRTVEEAVTNLVAKMSAAEKEKVRATRKADLIQYHLQWGVGIRNDFGLRRGNTNLLADCHTQQPDDASMVIIEAVWLRLQNQ